MIVRRLLALLVVVSIVVSCSSSSSDESATDPSATDPSSSDPGATDPTSSDPGATDAGDGTASSATTTTIPAPILALVGNLELAEGQCYAELPPPAEVEPDPTTTTPGQITEATDPTVPPTLAAPTTTPRPTIVAVVDCVENNNGTVYAAFCLGRHPEFDDDLTAEACPGDSSVEYPGDRTIRRAATRICLQRFTERFAEEYATSLRIASEFVPTEDLWGLDDRRVVCLVREPSP